KIEQAGLAPCLGAQFFAIQEPCLPAQVAKRGHERPLCRRWLECLFARKIRIHRLCTPEAPQKFKRENRFRLFGRASVLSHFLELLRGRARNPRQLPPGATFQSWSP